MQRLVSKWDTRNGSIALPVGDVTAAYAIAILKSPTKRPARKVLRPAGL
jgi:hypothetical protein